MTSRLRSTSGRNYRTSNVDPPCQGGLAVILFFDLLLRLVCAQRSRLLGVGPCDSSAVGGFADGELEMTDAYPLILPRYVSFRAQAGGTSRGGRSFLDPPQGRASGRAKEGLLMPPGDGFTSIFGPASRLLSCARCRDASTRTYYCNASAPLNRAQILSCIGRKTPALCCLFLSGTIPFFSCPQCICILGTAHLCPVHVQGLWTGVSVPRVRVLHTGVHASHFDD